MNSHANHRTLFVGFILIFVLVCCGFTLSANAQNNLRESVSQADYVIITPSAYVNSVQPLAAHRQSYSRLQVETITTEEIYQNFGQGTAPDTAIRKFITYASTSWPEPRPLYFLLAGNVNTIPSHIEPDSIVAGADSIPIDHWFVEGRFDSTSPVVPVASIGRLPAWNQNQLDATIAKLISYDTSDAGLWRRRAIAVGDYYELDGLIFETEAQELLSTLLPHWPDSMAVHVRTTSPAYRTRAEFRSLWERGASIISLVGHLNETMFSHASYFTSADVDTLRASTPLAFVRLMGRQSFRRETPLSISTSLLCAANKGAVATLSPVGYSYFYEGAMFFREVVRRMQQNTSTSIGLALFETLRSIGTSAQSRRETLLGDPATVVKSGALAGTRPPEPVAPQAFELLQNYPNPFNPSTRIAYTVPQSGMVSLVVFDVLGRAVATLADGYHSAGSYSLALDANEQGMSSGVYFCRLTMNDTFKMMKMVLMK
jgi:hypothetical protein